MSATDILMSAAGAAGDSKTYIEDVFSTYLYKGTNASQTINTGLDMSGKGGMLWVKSRNDVSSTWHQLMDTERGAANLIFSNATDAQLTDATALTSFNANGFTLGTSNRLNSTNDNFVSWSFRQAPNFFDVVTYTGDGVNNRQIAHSLGQAPGMVVVKSTSNASTNWIIWHRSLGGTNYNLYFDTNTSGPYGDFSHNGAGVMSSTSFCVSGGYGYANEPGQTYVAYLFGNDTTTDGLIQCGSWSGGFVNLGWEPQYLLIKNVQYVGGWQIVDTMRGLGADTQNSVGRLFANNSNAESVSTGSFSVSATGFNDNGNVTSNTIYMAIRRGPMKTPSDPTKVFYPQAIPQGNSIDSSNVPFAPDLVNTFSRDGTQRVVAYEQFQFADRLRGLGVPNNTFSAGTGAVSLVSSSTGAEQSGANVYIQLKADGRNITRSTGWNDPLYGNWIYYFMQRAPGFFDEVCYAGTGTTNNQAHNLGVAPELMIIKDRSASGDNWFVGCLFEDSAVFPNFQSLILNNTSSAGYQTYGGGILNSKPATSSFSLGSAGQVNRSSDTYVAYLFASCPGVSKVGSYTGNGGTQTISCGFSGGARFVLIKRTDSSGNWYVWDTARGMVAGTDPKLALNLTSEETNSNWVYTTTGGFQIVTSDASVNAAGGSYIFLAIA